MNTMVPFWTQTSKQWSNTLWLPPEKMESCVLHDNTWFHSCQHSDTTCHPVPDIPVQLEKPNGKPQLKVEKIRIYPSDVQKKTLNQWMGTARWIYNQCLAKLKVDKTTTKDQFRQDILGNKSPVGLANPWTKNTPRNIREYALSELLDAYFTNLKKGTPFHMKFRSRKDPQQSITIHNFEWTRKSGIFYQTIHPNTMKAEKPLPTQIYHDLIVTKNKLGHFYLCIPKDITQRPPSETPPKNVIACDPGVRTFLTGYDPSGRIIEYGKTDISRIHRLCHAYDRLQSKWTKSSHKHRYQMKKAGLRIQLKIRNLVDEMHKRLTLTLVLNYHTILLPKFNSSQMVGRTERRIASKTAKAMLTWSHFRFRQRLLSKAREYPWCQVVLCTEEYTSKTCTGCGHIHDKLGGNKKFHCPNCHLHIDRDINGARNILVKYLTESSRAATTASSVEV